MAVMIPRQNHPPPGSESLGPIPRTLVWCLKQWVTTQGGMEKVEKGRRDGARIHKIGPKAQAPTWEGISQPTIPASPDDVRAQRGWDQISVMIIAVPTPSGTAIKQRQQDDTKVPRIGRREGPDSTR